MPQVLLGALPYLFKGAVQTVWLSTVSVGMGTVLGILLGILSVLAHSSIRRLITAYTFGFRGTPVLVVMFLAYFALPAFGLMINVYAAVAGALILYSGAFVTEITRGAILAIPRAQTDAAKGLGMRRLLILRLVVLPQALRMSIPPLLNTAIFTIKSTSYASIVGVWELTYAAREVVERSLAAFQVFLGVMAIYFILCYPLSVLSRRLEARFSMIH